MIVNTIFTLKIKAQEFVEYIVSYILFYVYVQDACLEKSSFYIKRRPAFLEKIIQINKLQLTKHHKYGFKIDLVLYTSYIPRKIEEEITSDKI